MRAFKSKKINSMNLLIMLVFSMFLSGCNTPDKWATKEKRYYTPILFAWVDKTDLGEVVRKPSPDSSNISLTELHLKLVSGQETTAFQVYSGTDMSVVVLTERSDFLKVESMLNDFILWSKTPDGIRESKRNIATVYKDEGHYSFVNINGKPYLQITEGSGENNPWLGYVKNYNIVLEPDSVNILLKRVVQAEGYVFS